MCGIIGYLGGRGNPLPHVLGAMSAIIYRAPDSTGLGLFGSLDQPVRLRKCLGSVASLIPVLAQSPAFPDQPRRLADLWETDPATRAGRQERVLAWEGLADPQTPAPLLENLLRPDGERLAPGQRGRLAPPPAWVITNHQQLARSFAQAAGAHALSPVIWQALLAQQLAHRLGLAGLDASQTTEVLDELARQCGQVELSWGLAPAQEMAWLRQDPTAEEVFWRFMAQEPFGLPSDYDDDGVRGVHRILETAAVCRVHPHPRREEELQARLTARWSGADSVPTWRQAFAAEQGANVFGLAGAVLVSWLAEREFLPAWTERPPDAEEVARALAAGGTDPLFLRYLLPPVIAHGRWAMQSPVTVQNAHPFLDQRRQRLIVINGQFDGQLEAEVRDYLRQSGYQLRSENSAEYVSMLWGHHFDELALERDRGRAIAAQTAAGTEHLSLGSQSVDLRLLSRVQGLDDQRLDQEAFVAATRTISSRGGQVAALGISMLSPQTMYLGCHQRPVFLVQGGPDQAVMVVSDVNAAMGLFPQRHLDQVAADLGRLATWSRHQEASLWRAGGGVQERRQLREEVRRREAEILERVRVTVTALNGEEVLATVRTLVLGYQVRREIQVTSFGGQPLPEVERFVTHLNPRQSHKEIFQTFYETHLREIPGKLRDILDAYLPDPAVPPVLDLNQSRLRRRFGPNLAGLGRLVLLGMGSGVNVGRMARERLGRLLPGVRVEVLKPVELDHPRRVVDPERDLVVLLNWSGASAEMVQFATELGRQGVLMLAITEKSYSDLALVARKSLGTISTLAGEEVTYATIKTTACLLLCLHLFGSWLAAQRPEGPDPEHERLLALPQTLAEALADPDLGAFCRARAELAVRAPAWVILDRLARGLAQEAALKLEETSWAALGRALEHGDPTPRSLGPDAQLVVMASERRAWPLAQAAARRLRQEGLGCCLVVGPDLAPAARAEVGDDAVAVLPELAPELQPLVDLIFTYRLALECELAHGRREPGFPRNRAKSVTVGRSRPALPPSPELERLALVRSHEVLAPPATGADGPSPWEDQAHDQDERQVYAQMRSLAASVAQDDPLAGLLASPLEPWWERARQWLEDDEAELWLLAADRPALAAAKAVEGLWNRLRPGRLRAARVGEVPLNQNGPLLALTLGGDQATPQELEQATAQVGGHPLLWLGPARPLPQGFAAALHLGPALEQVRGAQLYLTLNLMLSAAWARQQAGRRPVIPALFRQLPGMLAAVLGDQGLWSDIQEAARDNRGYRTGLYAAPGVGDGLFWVERFDQRPGLVCDCHVYGEEGYGHLVTVDPDTARKFVRLEERDIMARRYGAERVARWEKLHLGGQDVDQALGRCGDAHAARPRGPFFVEGVWYLPVLRPDYDPLWDNLIMVDVSDPGLVNQALDSLGGYGCRSPRLLVLTQRWLGGQEGRDLFQYPISHLLNLPGLPGRQGEAPIPAPLLPLARDLVATALAAAGQAAQRETTF